MDLLLAELSDRLAALHQSIIKAINGLPDEALDWSPGPDMNTLSVLLTHTLGAERFWIGDIAGGEPSGRVRSDEFVATGKSVEDFIERSNNILAHSQSVVARLSIAELDDRRNVPQSDRQVTVAWAVLHALEHTALHAGHIEITRQLWEQRHTPHEEE